jgi:hypothetical protein
MRHTGEAMKQCALLGGILLLASAALPVAFAGGPSPALAPAAPQAGAPFTEDKGKLRILQGGAEAGDEQFDLTQSGNFWVAHGETVLHGQGGEVRSTGQLRLTADGTPVHYEWTAQTPKKAAGAVDFADGTAKTSINLDGKEHRQDFKFETTHVAVLDNNLYDQYAVLARLYDWKARGTQTFPVLIPQDTTPGSITLEPLDAKTVNGATLDGLRVRSTDLEIEIYFDARHRLMRLEVPAVNVVVVRE